MRKIKVGIAEDQGIFRSALGHLLSSFNSVSVVAMAENGKLLLEHDEIDNVDIAIVDYKMPIMGGIETSKELRNSHPDIKIIILSMFDDESFVEKAIENGANAYLSKDDDLEDLEMAVHSVLENEYYFNDRISKLFIKSMISKGKIVPIFVSSELSFSQMEISILDLISKEFTTQEIADKLFRSSRTIDKHRTEMMKKTGTRNSIGLLMYGIKKGLIKP
ncbi:MAG: DNA-binding NarL/FixJ family response regulator [Flavobacteriaceae bacterium]|jgi:DNA-binding NarL/FixJ family response regulator